MPFNFKHKNSIFTLHSHLVHHIYWGVGGWGGPKIKSWGAKETKCHPANQGLEPFSVRYDSIQHLGRTEHLGLSDTCSHTTELTHLYYLHVFTAGTSFQTVSKTRTRGETEILRSTVR